MLGWITICALIVTEAVFLYGLWSAPKRRAWTDPVALVAMAIVVIGSVGAFQDSGINGWWTLALIASFVLLVGATMLEYKEEMGAGARDTLVTAHMFIAVAVMMTFWLALQDLEGVSTTTVAITAAALGVYEVGTVIFLNLTGSGQKLREKKTIIMTILFVSVAIFILGFGSMLEGVGAF